ncbi:MAG: hypothetical protein HS126_03265 [Anaerolineales bacterium]|nr:hypothetical protein [Anaerolineales bacterium]
MGLEVEMVLVPVVRVHYSLKLLSQPPKKYIYTSEKIGYYVDYIVSKGISVVIEAAFQHPAWFPKLTHLAEVASVSLVVCTINPHLARARFIERVLADPTRERFHGDGAGTQQKMASELQTGSMIRQKWICQL